MEEDRRLLQAWRSGDSVAGRELFRRYFRIVRGFLHSKTDDVEELAQRTFEAVVQARHKLEIRSSVRAYILTVARHELYASFRARLESPETFAPDTHSVVALLPSPSQVLVGRAEHRLLLEALRSIPLDYQIVVELHYWDELSTAELADVLDIPRNTVKTRLRKARQLLAAELERLAESKELLESTTYNLDRWARAIREQAMHSATE